MADDRKLPPHHPRAPGGPRRTGPGDDELKKEMAHKAQWGAWGTDRWNGVDITYHIHIGGHNTPISIARLKVRRFALCAIVADFDHDPPRIGAAFGIYSRKTTTPSEVAWIEAPATEKAAKAIWLAFIRGTRALGFRWEQIYLLMSLNGVVRIPVANKERPSRIELPLDHEDQGVLDKRTWHVWSVEHYDHMEDGRFDYRDRMVKLDCPVKFEEGDTPEASHPAVRANAINYYTAMKAYSFGPPPRLLVPDYK